MSVETLEPELVSVIPEIARVRTLCRSASFIRQLVLPLPGHANRPDLLEAFRARAYVLPALPRTIDLFEGLVVTRPPQMGLTASVAEFKGNLTGSGDSIQRVALQILREILLAGRAFAFVDYPPAPIGATLGEVAAAGLRPMLRLYPSESIIGAVPGQIRLSESVQIQKTEFAVESVEQIRVLDVTGEGYRQRLFRKSGTGFQPFGEPVFPRAGGQFLAEIPGVFFRARDHRSAPARPPLIDLAEAQIAHLQNSALHEWGLMWAGSPTPVFTGLRLAEGESVSIGSSQGIVLGDGGSASFLEFTGQGLQPLASAMESKRRDMAALGARLLVDEPRAAIAAETARIQRSGEHSTLAAIAETVSEGVTRLLEYFARFAGDANPTGISFRLNTEFIPTPLEADVLRGLLQLSQAGAISPQELYAALQRRDVVDSAKPFEQHVAELDAFPTGGI